jgi:hypothetical protein
MNTITENRYKLAIYDMPYDTNNRMNYKAWKTIKLLKLLAEEQETRAITAEKQRDRLAEALRQIKSELGVPQPEYPAPVANAVKIADEALVAVEGGKQ